MPAHHVLIIEDDLMLSEMERDLLVRAGHEVTVLANLLDAYRNETWVGIDVALVDLWLPPPMKGADVMTFLAKNFPSIRRVLVTADDEAPQAIHDLANVVLIKPYTGPLLIQAIE